MFGITNSFLIDNTNKEWPVLWENANPSSNFAAQTVTVDLSDWSWIAVGAAVGTTGTSEMITLVRNGTSTTISLPNVGSTQYFYKRSITVSPTGVTFSTGYRNTTGTTGTSYCIPLRIYGVPGSNVSSFGGWTTLWENLDLTSSFAAQTISLDLSHWTTIAVKMQFHKTDSSDLTQKEISFISVGDYALATVHSLQRFRCRNVNVSSSGVAFSIGYQQQPDTATYTSNVNYAIPVAIYGVN